MDARLACFDSESGDRSFGNGCICEWNFLISVTLSSDVMMDLLWRSNTEIHKVPCGKPPTLIELRLYSSREGPVGG